MKKSITRFEFLEHPAELKIRAYGNDLQQLFSNCALGMMDYLYDNQQGQATQTETFTVEAPDLESLLIDWLAEILWLSDTNKRLYFTYNFKKFTDNKITTEVSSCEALAKNDIKAVTYNELAIEKLNTHWQATVVYDI